MNEDERREPKASHTDYRSSMKLPVDRLELFGEEAKRHDLSIREVMESSREGVATPISRLGVSSPVGDSKEGNPRQAWRQSTPQLGQILFVENAEIRPDGGVIEVMDRYDQFRVTLVSESKHQGNDVEKIRAGIKQGKNKDQDLMTAGNAIERVHKNIQEIRNLMMNEVHFPYVVFLQGSNFATTTFFAETPDGRKVRISHDAGNLNRIDRVTASSFGMGINQNYCRNIFVELDGKPQMLQAASFYFQSEPWTADDMAKALWDIAMTSLDVLSDSLPK